MMTRSYLWFDKRQDYNMPGFMCLQCGQPLTHDRAYVHALYECPNRKDVVRA